MALGGGVFSSMTKVMPGAYINFVSASSASSLLSGRGVVTMPVELDWGPEGMFEISQEDFLDDARPKFGYRATDSKLKALNDLFRHAETLYAYRLNTGGDVASNDLCTAKYAGERGNSLAIAITGNTDSSFDVVTYLDGEKVDIQTVTKAEELEANDYVTWKSGITISAITNSALTGGTNGSVEGAAYSNYLTAAESTEYEYNIMATDATDDTTKALFASFVKRMRDTHGRKFQVVLYNHQADYEGVINVRNPVSDPVSKVSELVYWVAGAEAACQVHESLLNSVYDGSYTVKVESTQTDLKTDIANGYFAFHNVMGKVRVLYDINSLTSTTTDKGDVFKDNKTIRIIDEIATDIANIFVDKYLGQVPNDADGRLAFWNDIVDNHKQLAKVRAIQNFDSADVVVTQGDNKNDVVVNDAIEVTGTMTKLYMTVVVS